MPEVLEVIKTTDPLTEAVSCHERTFKILVTELWIVFQERSLQVRKLIQRSRFLSGCDDSGSKQYGKWPIPR